MSRTLTVLAAALALTPAGAQPPKQALPQVTSHSFSVTKPVPGDDAAAALSTGTRVGILVEIPGLHLIGLDTQGSVLESFTDDRGTNLRAGKAGRRVARPEVSAAAASRGAADGKYLPVTFQGPGLPAAGATKVRVKATATVLVGKTEKTVEKKEVSLKAGVDLGVGALTLKEADPKSAFASDYVTYKGAKVIKKVVFLDPAGAEVALRSLTTGSITAAGLRAGEFFQSFHPEKAGTRIDKGTVKVTYFDEVGTFEVPVDLEVGPGL
jgi:hypothetical protein